MIRVLFVCLGNICRSPMAEAVFINQVREAGLEGKIEADSAGTGHWHLGERPHAGTRRVLADQGIDFDHRARLVNQRDLETFDYVVVMDEANFQDVRALGPVRGKLVRLMDYAPHTGVSEVPDPYYTGGFDGVYTLVREATAGLLAAIRQEHGL